MREESVGYPAHRPVYILHIVFNLLKSLRPKQWSKNFFVFAALLFSQNLFNLPLLYRTILAFVIFCLLSGSAYLINDLVDLERDRRHPEKCKRPLASGRLKPLHAVVALAVLLPVSLSISWYLGSLFFAASLAYFILQLLYSFSLKHLVILDVFSVAAGFVLRVVAGALVIGVRISSWLLLCTTLLALFLGLSKRRHELLILEQGAGEHRKVLGEYNFLLLDQMIAVVTASTLLSYSLYTVSAETVQKVGSENMIFTIPFVLYGIFRYLYLVYHKNSGGSPENLLITDKPLLVDIALWVVTVILILYCR